MAKRKPLVGLELAVKRAAIRYIDQSSALLKQRIADNISLTDHSISQLKSLGYPYSVNNTSQIHVPDYQVHNQTGNLLSALTVNKINQYRVQVGIDDSIAPYVGFIIFGTTKMVPRDFITGSFNELREQFSQLFRSIVRAEIDNI